MKDIFLLHTNLSTPGFANSYILDLETFTSQMRKSLISQIWKLLHLGGSGENLELLEFERMLGLRTMIQAFGAYNQ
jgi:hypothetical protein